MDALSISRFTSRLAPPVRSSISWQGIAEMLGDPCRTACTVVTCQGSACPHKEGGCWSPAVFSGNRRSRQDVEAVTCLVLDVDHATEATVEAFRGQLADYQHMLHTTHADRPGDRCMRVVVQLSRPVLPTEWSRFWAAAVFALGMPRDLACGDIARCYYLPSRPRDADYLAVVHMGDPLDVDAVLAAAPILDELAAQPVVQSPAQEGISP